MRTAWDHVPLLCTFIDWHERVAACGPEFRAGFLLRCRFPAARANLLAQQPPRAHLRLDLSRTLEDIQDARVAQHAADLVLRGVAVAAVDLERVVGAGPGDGCTQEPGAAGLEIAMVRR